MEFWLLFLIPGFADVINTLLQAILSLIGGPLT